MTPEELAALEPRELSDHAVNAIDTLGLCSDLVSLMDSVGPDGCIRRTTPNAVCMLMDDAIDTLRELYRRYAYLGQDGRSSYLAAHDFTPPATIRELDRRSDG